MTHNFNPTQIYGFGSPKNQGEPFPKNSILEKVSSDTESPKYDSFDFYEAQISKEGILKGITIHVTKFLKYVNSFGFIDMILIWIIQFMFGFRIIF